MLRIALQKPLVKALSAARLSADTPDGDETVKAIVPVRLTAGDGEIDSEDEPVGESPAISHREPLVLVLVEVVLLLLLVVVVDVLVTPVKLVQFVKKVEVEVLVVDVSVELVELEEFVDDDEFVVDDEFVDVEVSDELVEVLEFEVVVKEEL